MRSNKQGISLIVLVITIIVMIILAAAVVISLTNTGIINKASEAVNLANEKEVQHLASLIWAECKIDEADLTTIENKIIESLGNAAENYDIQVAENGVEVKRKFKVTLDDRSVISAETATTTLDTTKTYVAGETFTVTSAKACVVAISTDGGTSYTELGCIAVQGEENTYMFTIPANIASDFQIGIVLLGDANGDGTVKTNDPVRILRYLNSEFTTNNSLDSLTIYAADVNKDGTIDENDTNIIYNYLAYSVVLDWNINE